MRRSEPERPIVIVGGCGFIGANLADSFLSSGRPVTVLDNLSRSGVEENLTWLTERHGGRVHAVIADIREYDAIEPTLANANSVFHFAAQTAVTTSLTAPVEDFEVNARGTLNVLEAIRRSGRRIPLIYASTNKVYGSLADIEVVEQGGAWLPADPQLRARGIDEARPLAFCTPYGCSKGVADQYVLDYATSYGVPSAVLRMSCIYGPRQFGTEDQGWVAHFMIRASSGEPITIYGDGKQVRDILHVTDAVAAYRLILDRIEDLSGRAFNLGGGPANAVSLNAVLDAIAEIEGAPARVRHDAQRVGDQPYFVADTRSLNEATGWSAQIGWRPGLRDLAGWLATHRWVRAIETAERIVA